MQQLGVRQSDLEERFIHSGGNGGQNVNKVATCVVLTHAPTGIMVKCQKDRSQGLNRFFARRLLCERLEARLGLKDSPALLAIEKLRKQKQRRARRARKKAQ